MAPLDTAKSGVALRHAQAVQVLMTACGIDSSARIAFDARIRQLQRLGVPRRDDAIPVGRIDYGIVELAGLATAVRLMAAFMMPSLAARYVNERWKILAPVLMSGAGTTLPADYVARRLIGESTMVAIDASGLAELGSIGRHDERYVGELGTLIAVERTSFPAALAKLSGAGIILDTSTYMPTIVQGFSQATMATSGELAHELDRLRYVD